MTEELIHFQWKYAYSQLTGLKTEDGQPVEVISPGQHNHDSGPDFFNAKVKIGETLWAGNVEIHVKASDWDRHGHQTDPSYDTVILHVVANNDSPTLNSKGESIVNLTIQYPSKLEWEYLRLLGTNGWIPCSGRLKEFPALSLRMWLTNLCIERLEAKSQAVLSWVDAVEGSWEEAFYHSVARSFGLKVNALPFELMAKSIPLKVLARTRNNLHNLEALLFGQAGFLEKPNEDNTTYYQSLVKEYQYQRQKHGLNPIEHHLWKFMRLRPVSFPTVRIAQFAMLIHRSSGLFSRVMEAKDFKGMVSLLRVNCSEYWHTHYRFGKQSPEQSKTLGDDTVKVIVLNSVVPFMFAYGSVRGSQELKDRAMELLESLKPEANSVVKGFASEGVKADSTLFSQAMVELKTNYCDSGKCLFCPVGVKILMESNS